MNDPERLSEPSTATEEGAEDGGQPPSTRPQQRVPDADRPAFWSRVTRWMRPTEPQNIRENFTDALLSDTAGRTGFSPEERTMLHNILRLGEVRVEDIMIPRVDIEAIDQSIAIGALLALFEESGRSRMPVYAGTLDDPRGMVHIRDLLAHITRQARSGSSGGPVVNGTSTTNNVNDCASSANVSALPFDLAGVDLSQSVAEAGILRKVLFVPPSMHASDLMERMQATRTQMALVIDEFGGTDGLVSLEDIVEMIVGDIEDEHDDEETMIVGVAADVFIADAKAELEDVAEVIGPDFDVNRQMDDVDTIGGLIFSDLGRIPARGEVLRPVPGFDIHVLDADPRRIKRLRIVRNHSHASDRGENWVDTGEANGARNGAQRSSEFVAETTVAAANGTSRRSRSGEAERA